MKTNRKRGVAIEPERVYRVLLSFAAGVENAMPAIELARRLDLPVASDGYRYTIWRAVRQTIAAGYPICSNNGGYWVPATAIETIGAAKALEARGLEMVRSSERLVSVAIERFGSAACVAAAQEA